MTFKVGESGNKKGRPRGIADKRTKLRVLLESHAEILVAKMVELALEGDVIALRLCIERLIPRLRKEPIEIELNADDLKIKHDVIQAVLDGRLEMTEAERLLNFIKKEKDEDISYSIETSDPIEAAKVYQKIMMEK